MKSPLPYPSPHRDNCSSRSQITLEVRLMDELTYRAFGATNMIVEYPCGRVYATAMLETDPSKLSNHVQAAELAIMTRMQELNRDHGGTEEERSALRDALSGLTILRRELTQTLTKQP